MATKKTYTMAAMLRERYVEDGADLRSNLMYILFRAAAICRDGEFKENPYSMFLMLKGDGRESVEELQILETECINYIDYADYYSKAELDKKVDTLVKRCKERNVSPGVGVILRKASEVNMGEELFVEEWSL